MFRFGLDRAIAREDLKIRNLQEIKICVIKFMVDNKIDCTETIYQCDWVIENSLELIEQLFKMVESEIPKEET